LRTSLSLPFPILCDTEHRVVVARAWSGCETARCLDAREPIWRDSVVDIHSHILSGLDDGPRDFDTSLKMVRMALETGTTVLRLSCEGRAFG
jgi:hypothetical protein